MNDRIYLNTSKTVLALVAPLLILMPFQNCTQAKFGNGAGPSISSSANNGGNYDGKPFIHNDPTQPCASKEVTRSVIVFKDGKYSLIKNDCVDVSPALAVPSTDIQVDPAHTAMLTYKGRKYIFDATTLLANPPDLNCTKKNFGPVDSVKIYIADGPAGKMMTGYFVGSGKSSVLAFDKTALDTSASSIMTGINQQANMTLVLSKFDVQAKYPDGANTETSLDISGVGSNSFLFCARPNGSL